MPHGTIEKGNDHCRGELRRTLWGLSCKKHRCPLSRCKDNRCGRRPHGGRGVELISGISSSFGLIEVIRTYRELRSTFRKAVAALSSFMPQVLVLIDYPDFNLRLAAEAKKKGIKVLYYVSLRCGLGGKAAYILSAGSSIKWR